VAATDDEVEAGELEPLDGRRKDRQVVAVRARRPGQVLREGRVDGPAFDERRHRAPHVQQREELGVREHLEQPLQGLLAPAHAGEPVVDDGDAHHACPSTWR